MLYISSLEFTYFLTASFYPLINIFSVPAPLFPAPGKHYSNLCLFKITLFILVSTYNWYCTFLFLSDLSYLALLKIADFPSLFWLFNIPLSVYVCVCIYMMFSLFLHLLTYVVFTFWLNKATVNKQISFWFPVFISSGYIPRRGIVGSYGNSILNFLRNVLTVFYSDWNNLYSYQ